MTRAADLAKLIAGGGTITVDDNSENLKLVTTDADANVGPTLRMDRQSASAADGDLLGKVNFVGHNDAGTPEDIAYAGITAIINDSTDGEEDGKLAINTIVAGSEVSRIFIDAGETVFNENGVNVDFRVESDGLTNAFVIDAGNNGIGFGHTPRSDLHTSWTQSFFGIEGSIISQVNSGGGIAGMSVTQNTYVDSGTGGYAYMTTNEATKLDLKDGVVAFSRAASGTAGNAISFSESMRIDASGNVAIGTTSAAAKLHVESASGSITPSVHADELLVEGSGNSGITIGSGTSGLGSLRFADSGGDSQGQVNYDHSGNHMSFFTADSERMRINDDGSLFINHASNTHPIVGTERLGVVGGTGSTAVAIACNAGNATGVGLFVGSTPNGAVDFVKFSSGSGGDTRGLIEFDGSNMTYGGTSDYRLKENIATYTKGIETLKKLNPIAFTWKESKASDVGFLAHEVAEIHPSAVSGDKDGMETVAGEEKIRPQMLDPSKLVGILTGALQEAIAKIETLEAKVATLESK